MQFNKHLASIAKKRFGQNFLQDQTVIDNIITSINPRSDQFLLEIGPGLGALTQVVVELIDKLTVIELDRDLAEKLRTHPFIKDKLEIIEADALKVNFAELSKQKGKKIRVFGNLPYNISTPLIFHLFEYNAYISDMFFMLQKEVVNRLIASPNTKAYGRLSIMAQYYCNIIPVLEVPPSAFVPAPKVDSAVVCLIPHQQIKNPALDLKILNKVVTTAFMHRRKTLTNALSDLFEKQELKQLNLKLDVRPENLTIDDYVNLANYLVKKQEI